MPRCLIADAPGIETDDGEVPAPPRRLLRKNKLDEIARVQSSGFVRLGQRMTVRGHGNDQDAFDVDAAKSRHVHVQQVSHADAGMAVLDHALTPPESAPRGERAQSGIGREIHEAGSSADRSAACCRPQVTPHLEFIEETSDARTQCLHAVGNRPGSDAGSDSARSSLERSWIGKEGAGKSAAGLQCTPTGNCTSNRMSATSLIRAGVTSFFLQVRAAPD